MNITDIPINATAIISELSTHQLRLTVLTKEHLAG